MIVSKLRSDGDGRTRVTERFVFSTKNRERLLDGDIQSRLFEDMGGILRAEKSVLLAAGGMADHVHLLVSLSRELSIAETVRIVKANSSKWVHQTFPKRSSYRPVGA